MFVWLINYSKKYCWQIYYERKNIVEWLINLANKFKQFKEDGYPVLKLRKKKRMIMKLGEKK